MRSYNKEEINHINLFEKITKARVKDCFLNDIIVFIVEEGDLGKAIGKKGFNKLFSETAEKRYG